uniref:Mitochondrial dicarboxylate carrier n=1 Tax=Rousettus aegyptiacus TaxID=9407 RepID=A0A7J8GBR7_ROUAE|nr:hypothetical protein HJG63_011794 [Rousettus aegyptiacus]
MAAEVRVSRWYFGGLASCGAACCTHPLDLLKVHLQTQQEVKLRMTGMALQVVRSDGFLALYNGLSASLCRQMTYSLTRFAIYETVRDKVAKGSQGPLPFYQKVLLGSLSGCIGGFVGTPADMVNVRMQNDMKLPQDQRRNYAHALDGLYRVAREEGLKKLFSGATMASSRGMLVTVGQLSCYDQAKQLVLSTGYLPDNIVTHFIASFIAGGCATFLCQPLDVLKTRLMNSKGRSPLHHGDCKTRANGLLQGPLARRDPPHAPHCAHVHVSGTASETLWHQSAILMGPRERAGPCWPPVPGSSRVPASQALPRAQHLPTGLQPPFLAQDPLPVLPHLPGLELYPSPPPL